MSYGDVYLDRLGRASSSAVSLAALLRAFAVSRVSFRTARLDLRFDDVCEPDAFAVDSNFMKAALALFVRGRIVITASGCGDESVGHFANVLARRKTWEVTYIKTTTLHGDRIDQRDVNENDITSEMEEEESFAESERYVYVWQLFLFLNDRSVRGNNL